MTNKNDIISILRQIADDIEVGECWFRRSPGGGELIAFSVVYCDRDPEENVGGGAYVWIDPDVDPDSDTFKIADQMVEHFKHDWKLC